MAEQRQGGPRTKSRKTARKASAPYHLDSEGGTGGSEDPQGEGAPEASTGEQAPDEAQAAPEPREEEPAEAEASASPEPEVSASPEPEVSASPPEPEAPAPPPEHAPAPPAAAFAALLPPDAIEPGDPEADAPPPGPAPPGDSRSFRRRSGGVEEFCLIYRQENVLITRSGVVGRNGTWSVVEYPSQGAAAHAYAQQCSELAGRGFYDLPRT